MAHDEKTQTSKSMTRAANKKNLCIAINLLNMTLKINFLGVVHKLRNQEGQLKPWEGGGSRGGQVQLKVAKEHGLNQKVICHRLDWLIWLPLCE